MTKVYLSGPISMTTYAGATTWYDEVADRVDPSIQLLRPMRFARYLRSHEGVIGLHSAEAPTVRLDDEAAALDRIFTTRAAVAGVDRYDVQRADAVLMNLTGCNERVSIGCMIEAGWADAARRPICLVMEAGNVHAGHPILEHLATWRVSTLAEGCMVMNALFGLGDER